MCVRLDKPVCITVKLFRYVLMYCVQCSSVHVCHTSGTAAVLQNKSGDPGLRINLDAAGQINGVPVYDYDPTSSDRPWKQPGNCLVTVITLVSGSSDKGLFILRLYLPTHLL